jgi:hypothetical protein
MARNKANRKKQLANSNWQLATANQPSINSRHNHPTEALQPVKAHIYRALAELNGGFEKVIQDLKTLQQVSFLRSENLAGMHDLICGIRAEANRECLGALGEREEANAGYFGRGRGGCRGVARAG